VSTDVSPSAYSRSSAEQFRAALAEAGIEDYVRPFHDLRHTALTNEAASGSGPVAPMTKADTRT
jgi:hypothetical protein